VFEPWSRRQLEPVRLRCHEEVLHARHGCLRGLNTTSPDTWSYQWMKSVMKARGNWSLNRRDGSRSSLKTSESVLLLSVNSLRCHKSSGHMIGTSGYSDLLRIAFHSDYQHILFRHPKMKLVAMIDRFGGEAHSRFISWGNIKGRSREQCLVGCMAPVLRW
jgi:hypothetical protein